MTSATTLRIALRGAHIVGACWRLVNVARRGAAYPSPLNARGASRNCLGAALKIMAIVASWRLVIFDAGRIGVTCCCLLSHLWRHRGVRARRQCRMPRSVEHRHRIGAAKPQHRCARGAATMSRSNVMASACHSTAYAPLSSCAACLWHYQQRYIFIWRITYLQA